MLVSDVHFAESIQIDEMTLDASSPEADLDWLAWRYVAREMAEQEQSSFETRLADDQQAREAVDRAVELHEAVRLASVAAPRSVLSLPSNPVWWSAALAAAVLVAVLLWQGGILPRRGKVADPVARQPSTKTEAVADEEVADHLALVWAEMQTQSAAAAGDQAVGSVVQEQLSDLDPGASAAADPPQDSPVPQWLLTALAADPDLNQENR